ncbi:roadblock/LC7 domain-containing protein [Kitasatospora sp. NPDC059327]|uniref:roadblock/LC7 domain-containing protein n=1 Tax=Kitasatospora sp. NPDC059327 TaxID=3346803 RepID=UPI00367B143D
MTRRTDAGRALNRPLDQLPARVPETRNALGRSADGLSVGLSRGPDRADRKHLSAAASGLPGLARGTGDRVHGGRVRQTVIARGRLFLCVATAGRGAGVAVLTGEAGDTDPGGGA